MTVNSFFNNGLGVGTASEQDLAESLIIELIQMSGHNFLFIPRDRFLEDKLFQEIPTEKYSSYKQLEMYIANVTDLGGQGEIFSKFGLEVDDTVDLVVARKRYHEEVSPDAPHAGDLIYFPLTKHLFEIKFVDDEPGGISGLNQFYSLSKLYTYMFKCTLYRYSYDEFDTGIDILDNQLDPDIFSDQGVSNHHEVIEEEAAAALDWSEDNPFGETTGGI